MKVICVIVFGAIFFDGICSTCPSQYTNVVNGYRFTRFDDEATAADASFNCDKLYGDQDDLALIKTNESSEAVHSIIRGCNKFFYIGLRYENDGWYWNDGTSLTTEQSLWQAGEGATLDELCSCVNSNNQTWIDERCAEKHPYICQKELLYLKAGDDLYESLGKNVTLSVNLISEDGPVNMSVYKIPDEENAIYIEYNVKEGRFEYEITNTTTNDNGTFAFVATREGYERSASQSLYIRDPAKITTKLPQEVSSPVTRGPSNISCLSTGYPIPTTYWTMNDVSITQDSNNPGVYQSIVGSNAILHIGDAIGSDDGTYICVAENVISANADDVPDEKDTRDIKLRVFGRPTIIETVPLCTDRATINITWLANNQTLGINHLIEYKFLSRQDESGVSFNVTVNATDSEIQTEIAGLQRNSRYNIKITVCPDDCIEKLSDNDTISAEVTDPVSNASVMESNAGSNKTCDVRWFWNDTTYPGDILTFKIVQSWISVSSRDSNNVPEQQQYHVNLSKSSEYFFEAQTEPNRNYTFDIYVTDCVGDDNGTRAEGQCLSPVSEPNYISEVACCDAGKTTLTTQEIPVPIPDETNGPISCLFIMVKRGGGQVGDVDFDRIQNLSDTTGSSSPVIGDEYIAVAVEMSEVYDLENYTIVIGDNNETSCDIYQISSSSNQMTFNETSRTYGGFNWNLTVGEKYSVYVVSTTPDNINDVVYVAQGEHSTFTHKFYVGYIPPGEPILSPTVIGLLGSVLLVVIVAAIVYWCYKKFKPSMKDHGGNQTCENGKTFPENPPVAADANITVERSNSLLTTPSTSFCPTAVPLGDLCNKFVDLSENEGQKFVAEFEELKGKTELIDASTTVGSNTDLKKKNRYKNVLPYDHNRVALTSGEAFVAESYINASFINGFERDKKFIATQGPLPFTVNDFWKMVTEQRSRVLAMATNLVENRRKKCERYWPDLATSQEYENVTVSTVSERQIGGYTKRVFELSDGFSNQTVVQFQLMNWPDHGVPITTSNFVRFHRACMEAQGNNTEPIIVHCSAGAGRTGTIIAYEYLTREASTKGTVDVFQCVLKMREQRMDMVQTCDQYKFVYRLLAEYYLLEERDYDAEVFYATPTLNNPTSFDLQEQLRKLDEASRFPTIAPDKVPFLLNVSVTWRPEDGDDIARFDAVKIETYDGAFDLMASAPPSKSTAETFWRLNLDNDISFIVSISDPTMQSQENVNECWPSQDRCIREFGSLSVELSLLEEKRHFHTRNLFVRRDSSLQTKEIKQYKILKWRPKIALNIIKDIRKSCSHWSGIKKPRVLVHCSQGFGETGSFCALINLVARLETEHRIDVFRTVKDLKDAKAELVADLKNYKFCYDAMKYCDHPKRKKSAGSLINPHAYPNEPVTTTL